MKRRRRNVPPRIRRAALVLLAVVAGTFLAWRSVRSLAGVPVIAARHEDSRRVLDRNGELLRHLPSDEWTRGRPVPVDELGERIVQATIVAEDQRFYEHQGVDVLALLRASSQALKHGKTISGASTITQQLVKLGRGEHGLRGRSIGDKLFEMAQAANLEEELSKDAILAAYFDRLSYGHGVVGPEQAALFYFGVRARDLSWAQAALLAVLPRAPTYLDPLRHPERARVRQRVLLEALHARDDMTAQELRYALAEEVKPRAHQLPFDAPHFVDMLAREGRLRESGPTKTTIDLALQRDLQVSARHHIAKLAERGARHAALIVVDNVSGDVLAYVGNADIDEPTAGHVDTASARRQPGSALKPFVYALAAESHELPAGPLADVPLAYVSAHETYVPSNFDGGFSGPVAARDALATSLNIPVLRLAASLGEPRIVAGLQRFGLSSVASSGTEHGATIALGSAEVTLRELATAYSTLARGGSRPTLRYTSDDAASEPVAVLSNETAATITDALSDPLARLGGPAVPRGYGLAFPVAVKTGTSSGYRDAWTAGYTRERTVVVWIGDATGAPMRELTGAAAAGPLFMEAIERAMRDVDSPVSLAADDALEEREVCPLSGMSPGPDCPHAARRRVPRGEPKGTCALHRRARPTRAGWTCDPHGELIAMMPPAFDAWIERQGTARDAHGTRLVSASRVTGCADGSKPAASVSLVEPRDATTFLLDTRGETRTARVRASARVAAAPTSAEVEILVDGRVAARLGAPFETWLDLPRGHHDVSARVRSSDVVIRTTDASRVTVR